MKIWYYEQKGSDDLVPDLENVYYRLNDKGEIKLCILFCIRYAGEPLSDTDIKHIMISATKIDFLLLCDVLESLFPENYIKKVWRSETEKYDLTKTGLETVDNFDDKIMASVRASIKKTIDEYFKRNGPKTQIKCQLEPVSGDLYNINAEITEGKTTLLSMTVFSGSKEKSARFAKAFRKKPMEFYESMINTLSHLADEVEKEEE